MSDIIVNVVAKNTPYISIKVDENSAQQAKDAAAALMIILNELRGSDFSLLSEKLERGDYQGNAAGIVQLIQDKLADSQIVNNVNTSSATPHIALGNVHAFVGPGTYINWGGVVVTAQNIGLISRVGSIYGVSLMPFDLSGYGKVVDVDILKEVTAPIVNKSNIDFALTDGDGNVIFKIDENGLKTNKYNICDSSGVIVGSLDASLLSDILKVTPLVGAINTDVRYKDGHYITDNDNNVVFKYDTNGLDVAKISNHFISLLGFLEGIKSKKIDILDNQGNIVGTINNESIKGINSAVDLSKTVNLDSRYLDEFHLTDESGFTAFRYNSDGLDAAKLSPHLLSLLGGGSSASKVTKIGNYYDDINLNIVYGQSLAMGGSTIGFEDFYTSKMFEAGVSILPPPDADINSEAYNETYFGDMIDMSSNGGGLNARMLCKKWNELIADENGINLDDFNFNLMGLVAGVSGGQWYQLAKQYVNIDASGWATVTNFSPNNEGRAYAHLMHGIYFAKKRANAKGKSLNVNTLSWVQGEASSDNDDTVTEYYNKLVTIFTDINNDVKLITGQKNDVQFIIYQNSSFAIYQVPTHPSYTQGRYSEGVPLACLKVAIDLPNVHFATPLYPYSKPKNSDDVIHISNVGTAMMASHFGIIGKKVVTDGAFPKPIYPNKIKVNNFNGVFYTKITFDVPVRPLVFDTEGDDGTNMRGHGLQPNYGFSILSGTTEIITDVRLSADDSVIIITNINPTGLSLTYAWTGVLGGGNLRDSQGDNITTEFNGTTYRCDNWTPFFRITI